MINKSMMMLAMLAFVWMTLSKNPMKVSFTILTSTALLFNSIQLQTGNIWFPLIFFILFTGGILMMFMILSSVMPNEKTLKGKIPKLIFLMPFLFLITINNKMSMTSSFQQIKSMISSSMIFPVMNLIILVYFFNSMSFNSAEEYPMRSFQCSCEVIL